MMRKYRKKAVVIEAIQFVDTAECAIAINEFMRMDTRIDYADPENPVVKIETQEGTMAASVGDYIIKGVNGEFYPCKPDIFEKTYVAAENSGMSFGQAIEAMKAGKKVARKGWNGKGMFLWLLPEAEVKREWVKDERLLECFGTQDALKCCGSIRMKTATGEVLTGWLASQTDMLCEDWEIVG